MDCRSLRASTIARMGRHYEQVLEGIVAEPDRAVTSLGLLSPAEWEQAVEQWNDTAASYPSEVCVHELLAAQAERSPEGIAVAVAVAGSGRGGL